MSKKKQGSKKPPKLKAARSRTLGRGRKASASSWIDRVEGLGERLGFLSAVGRSIGRLWSGVEKLVKEAGPGVLLISVVPLLVFIPAGPPELRNLMALVLAAVAAGLVLTGRFSRSQYRFFSLPVDLAVALPLGALVISTFLGASLRGGITSLLTFLLFFLAYWIVSRAEGENYHALPLRLLALGGALWSILWVFTPAVFPAQGQFFLAVSLVAALYLEPGHLLEGRLWRLVPLVILWGVLLVPSFTGLIAAGLALLLLFILSPHLRARLGLGAFLATVPAALALVVSGVTGSPALGLVLGAFSVLGLDHLARLSALPGAGAASAATYLASAFYLGRNWLAEEAFVWQQQLLDALKMLGDHAILGAGGGAWETLYRSYRAFAYDGAGGPPSWALGWLLDTGVTGLVVLAAAAGILIYWARPFFRAPLGSFLLGALVGWAVLPPAGPAGALILGLLSGMVLNSSRADRVMKQEGYRLAPRLAGYGFLLVVVLLSLTLAMGPVFALRGEARMGAGNVQGGHRLLSQAVAYDPLSGELWALLGWAERNIGMATEAGDLLARAETHLARARAAEPSNPDFHQLYGRLARDMGWHEEAEEAFLQALAADPRNPGRYQDLAGFYGLWAQREQGWGDPQLLPQIRERAEDLALRRSQEEMRQPASLPEEESLAPARAACELALGQILAMEWQLETALEHLENARQATLRDEAEIEAWIGVVHEARGDIARAQDILEPLLEERPDLEDTLNLVRFLLGLAELED